MAERLHGIDINKQQISPPKSGVKRHYKYVQAPFERT